MNTRRVVVCSLGGHGQHPFELPRSEYAHRPRIAGGERTLYELAVAARCAGHEVELRGLISRPVLDELVVGAGLTERTGPTVGLPARVARDDDIVVVPEGYPEPVSFVPAALSPARSVLFLLGPPGLYGWSFTGAYTGLDSLTVDPDSVGRTEHFRAIAGLGFELWSNSPGLADAAQAAGIDCRFLGTGSPVAAPPRVDKTHDVAVIGANRWAPLALQVVTELGPDVSSLVIGELADCTIAASVAPARILVWPSRIEGDSRIQREARSVGTVPVALSTNRFAAQLDEAGGAVVVPCVADLAPAIRSLLDDPARLAALSDRAAASARAQIDWPSYVERVDEALRSTSADPSRFARGAMASAVSSVLSDLERHVLELGEVKDVARGELEAARDVIADRESVLAGVVAELERLRAEQAELRIGLDAALAQLVDADLAVEAAEARAAALRAEVLAYRRRMAVRLADRAGRLRPRGSH